MALSRIARSAPALGAAALVAWLAVAADPRHPGVLFNTTPSEPEGIYVQARRAPDVGRLIAFRMPEAAFPYADARLPHLRRELVLKRVAARPGETVCTVSGRLVIGGRDRAAIAAKDREGRTLPRWRGCRALAAGELFVFSDRVANSFDSRYFGPVTLDRIAGVYEPLATVPETP